MAHSFMMSIVAHGLPYRNVSAHASPSLSILSVALTATSSI